MENKNENLITKEWFKTNRWRYFQDTANNTINKITYFLRKLESPEYEGDIYRVSKKVALVADVETVEELTTTGKEFQEDTVIVFQSRNTPISRSWPEENGWERIVNGDNEFRKCINGVWYELEYTDFYTDYILKKDIAMVRTVEELESLLNL